MSLIGLIACGIRCFDLMMIDGIGSDLNEASMMNVLFNIVWKMFFGEIGFQLYNYDMESFNKVSNTAII